MKRTIFLPPLLLLCAMLLTACAGSPAPQPTAAPATEPPAPATAATATPAEPTLQETLALAFTDADVQHIAAQFSSVEAYVGALSPTAFSWWYEGDATGNTYLQLISEDAEGFLLGTATIVLQWEGGLFGDEVGTSGFLPEEILGLPAWLAEAEWLEAAYALPAVRGVPVGAAAQQVTDAFFSLTPNAPSYTARDINPEVNDTWDLSEYAFIGATVEAEPGVDGETYCYRWCTLDAPEEWRESYLLEYGIVDGVVEHILLTYDADPE